LTRCVSFWPKLWYKLTSWTFGILRIPLLLCHTLEMQSRETFVMTRQALQEVVETCIPPLFDTKMLFWPAAREALNDTRWDDRTTLPQKYQRTTKPLYKAGRNLAKEVLARLDMEAPRMTFSESVGKGVNELMTKLFRRSR
jgi:hypothetical protein